MHSTQGSRDPARWDARAGFSFSGRVTRRPTGEWNDDDFDVLADGVVVGRIFNAAAAPVGNTGDVDARLCHHEDRTPTHGYEPTREAAMAAFAKSLGMDTE
jgi:hypothetical protein